MKSESFTGFLAMPSRCPEETFELALGTADAPRGQLSAHGWRIRDPLALAKDPGGFQDYLRSSKGEFSVAKHGYVASRSGWFSERSASYLASGRPVIVQDTGFTDWLPSGLTSLGVLPFSSLDEAVDAVARIRGDYARHCRAAREIAAEYFDSARVLPDLIEKAIGGDR
jgi:hypothetical protein